MEFLKQKSKRMTQRDIVDDANNECRFAAIEREADAIMAREGPNHVRGLYFVKESDAYMARMVAAEQIVAKRDESMDSYIAKGRTAPAENSAPVVLDLMEALKKSLKESAARAHCPEMSVTGGES